MANAQAAALFGTVPKKDFFHFFEGVVPQASKVVKFLDYRKEDVSVATNVPVSSVRYDEKMPAEVKERIVQWANAINLVGNYFQDEAKTMLWFQIPNPQLGGYSPRDLIRLGRFNKLMKFIQTALDENSRE
jgi:uncharacterized protein (DUF2384 family)